MELESLVIYLLNQTDQHPVTIYALIITSVLGTLSVAATAVVKYTQTKKDDEAIEKLRARPIVGKIFSFLERFSLVKPK